MDVSSGGFGSVLNRLIERDGTRQSASETPVHPQGFGEGFYSDDEDSKEGNNFSFENDFESMEQREQERTENMLLETEFKLFHEQYNYKKLIAEERRKNAQDNRQSEKHRYFSMGYSANVDQVDDLEIARWQSRFPYFHIVGLGEEPREEPKIVFDDDLEAQSDMLNEEDPQVDQILLSIIGMKATLHVPPSNFTSADIDGVDEELINIDGTLEEIIAIHCDSEITGKKSDSIIVEVEPI